MKTDRWYKEQPEWGTPESDKKARDMTPGQIDEEDYDRKRDRQAERGTRKVTAPRSGYKSDPDSTRKAYDAAMKNIKKVLNKESVKSADKRPEKYVDANGKTRVRMVPVDTDVVKNESIKPTTAQIRMNRALKKHGVGKNDEFYKKHMSPDARKKLEPQKRPEPAQVKKPVKSFKWFATRDMKND